MPRCLGCSFVELPKGIRQFLGYNFVEYPYYFHELMGWGFKNLLPDAGAKLHQIMKANRCE
jgi:hypothetical protein